MIQYITDNLYDEAHLETMELLSKYFDADIATCANAAEEIIENIKEKIETELSNAE